MNDPVAPRKPKGWPLLAISLLVLLLAGFLVVRFRRKEEVPVLVKEPPAPTRPVESTSEAPKPPENPEKTDTRPADPGPAPGSGEFEQHVKTLRKALEAKNWDDAAAAFEAARKLRADAAELKGIEDLIAEGRKAVEAARLDSARKAELKLKQDRAWALEKERVERDERGKDLWDAALLSLEKFRKEYPGVERDEDYARFLAKVKDFQAEADKLFKKDLAAAQAHFAAGRYGQAVGAAEGALSVYPERKPAVREFQDRVREAQSEKSMVRIPETACWIGSDDRPDEKPLRQVKLPPFLIDKYEVTNEDYAAFVATTGHPEPPYWLGKKPPKGRERHPVVMVNWDDAAAYAKWAGKRLPTAEEWEVAARGFDKREFPWGNVFLEKEDKFPGNCLEYWQVHKGEPPGTRVVEDFDNGASTFGVYGMGGNVWEWTSTAGAAKGTKPPGEFRVLKGGSFMTPQRALRCANVYSEDPRIAHPDVGFRCVRDVK
jgi:formylglycine-generating enzyme required for sulfatase activity